MPAVVAMLILLVLYAVTCVSLVGYGRFVLRLVDDSRVDSSFGLFVSWWAGLMVVLTLLQFVHLLSAISRPVGFGILMGEIALAALEFRGQSFRTLFDAFRQRRATWVVIAVSVLLLLNRSIGPSDLDDSGQYHFGQITWVKQSAAVVGLANLSPWLAMNSSWVLWLGLLDQLPPALHCHHVGNGLLMCVMASGSIWACGSLWQRGTTDTLVVSQSLLALSSGPIWVNAFSRHISAPSTDPPATFFALGALWMTLRFCKARERVLGLLIFPMWATAVSIKLSMAVMAVGAVVVLVLVARRALFECRGLCEQRVITFGLAWAAAIACAWTTKNAIQTGYPLYVSRAVALPVIHRLPPDRLDGLHESFGFVPKVIPPNMVLSSLRRTPLRPLVERLPEPPPLEPVVMPSGWSWVTPWLATQLFIAPIELVIPLLLWILACCLLVSRRQFGLELWFIVPLVVALGYWFVVAPDRRFATPITWGLAVIGWGVFSTHWPPGRRYTVVIALLMCILSLLFHVGMTALRTTANPLRTLPFLRGGQGPLGFYPVPQTPDLKPWTSRHGSIVQVPADPEMRFIWRARQPALGVPKPDPNLRGDAQNGFWTDRGDPK